jgi:hypothetical protein
MRQEFIAKTFRDEIHTPATVHGDTQRATNNKPLSHFTPNPFVYGSNAYFKRFSSVKILKRKGVVIKNADDL